MSESRSASAGILPAKEINKGHNKPAFYGNLQRLDSYVLEHSSRVRIAVVPTRPELPIGSATTLLKEQAEDVWSIGLLSLALFCGMRTPIGGIFGSLLKEGNLSGLGPEDADLEAELFDIIASLRQSEDLTLFGPASQSNMPHMSRHFAELLVQVLQSDWRNRPCAKDLLDGEFSFLHAHRTSASLPATLFPVQRPFRRRTSAPPAESAGLEGEDSAWSRLREAETSFGHRQPTRSRVSVPLSTPPQKNVLPKLPARYHKDALSQRRGRTPLQDISNLAQGDITVEPQQRDPFQSPQWRDDTTILEDEESPIARTSKRGQHFYALSKLSQHVRSGQRQELTEHIDELPCPPKTSPRIAKERQPLTIPPEYRYSSSRRASMDIRPVLNKARAKERADPDMSTWSESDTDHDHSDEAHQLSSSPKTRSTAAKSPRRSPPRDMDKAESSTPMQSTPPRPVRKEKQKSPITKSLQTPAGPTLAQKRLVRRALGSPEIDAPWSKERTSRRSDKSSTNGDSRTLVSAKRERFATPGSDDNAEQYATGGKAKDFITPARVPKSGSGMVASATQSTIFPESPFSCAGSSEPPPLLDLRGLEGIRQRTRYGKIYVLPNADESTRSQAQRRAQKIRLVKKTVFIALRGEGRGVGIQADIETVSSKTISAWALPTITVSLGALQPSGQASDVPGRLENWQSWKLNLERKEGEDEEDGPPDWVLRVYAHICRWAQRRRQDLLRRVHA
ncbi:hypothetical protein A4X03_0g1963 [Tilletia caries]|uniref:Protein kinase domain-containing protein n=1 Tax=Tilletia caries TaxID=13290 RepID=A0A8T8TP43_9BASI|nr:hypothetical protein A4X03_0g1963 [Tilletia caries]